MPFKYFVFLICVLFALTGFSYSGSYYYESHVNHFIKYDIVEQYITNNKNEKVTSLKLGEGFNVHKEIKNYNNSCFADYVLNMHNDNVDYQFPRTITRDIYQKNSSFNLNGHYVIPTDIPTGHYLIYQVAYPYCRGMTIDPFRTDLKLEVDIHD